jgi:hypothetical protein
VFQNQNKESRVVRAEKKKGMENAREGIKMLENSQKSYRRKCG